MSKKWVAPAYVFFKPSACVEYVEGRKAHVFECIATRCRCKSRYVRHFLYTRDTSSTSNLRRHTKICWGDEVVKAADATGNLQTAREALSKKKGLNGSITAAFERIKKSNVTYSQRPYTKLETRYV